MPVIDAAGSTHDEIRQHIAHSLRVGQTDQALSLVDMAFTRWPNSFGPYLLKAQVMEAEGRTAEAISTLRHATEGFPDASRPALALARIHLKAEQCVEARAALALATERGVDDEIRFQLEVEIAGASKDASAISEMRSNVETFVTDQSAPSAKLLVTLARARLADKDAAGAQEAAIRALGCDPTLKRAAMIAGQAATEQGDAKQAIAYYRHLADLTSDDPRWPLVLARLHLKSGQYTEARAALALAAERGVDSEVQLELEVEIVASSDDPSAISKTRANAETFVINQLTPSARVLVTLAQARLADQDAAGAQEAAIRALGCDPTLKRALMIAGQAAIDQGDTKQAIAHYRHLADLTPDDPRWPLRVASMLNLEGSRHEALGELDAITRRWPTHRVVEHFLEHSGLNGKRMDAVTRPAPAVPREAGLTANLRALFTAAPTEADFTRPIVVDDLESDVLIAECPGADTVLFIFTSNNDSVLMPLPMFDRYLATLGLSAVYLKDFSRLLFAHGVRSLGDSHETTVAGLRAIATRLKARRLCTLGYSGGARPAIRCGVQLGASNIVGIAGATGKAPCLPSRRARDGRVTPRRVRGQVPEETLDLKPLLGAGQFQSKIVLVYGAEAESEAANAAYLQGIPGITLYPVSGSTQTMLSLASQGDFTRTLGALLGIQAGQTMSSA